MEKSYDYNADMEKRAEAWLKAATERAEGLSHEELKREYLRAINLIKNHDTQDRKFQQSLKGVKCYIGRIERSMDFVVEPIILDMQLNIDSYEKTRRTHENSTKE